MSTTETQYVLEALTGDYGIDEDWVELRFALLHDVVHVRRKNKGRA